MSTSHDITNSLTAVVDATIVVDGNGGLDVCLLIQARNNTDSVIRLDDATYKLPLARAYNHSAWYKPTPNAKREEKSRLEVWFRDRCLEVQFKEGMEVQPRATFCWELQYGTPGHFQQTEIGDIIIGPYLITPLKEYKGIPIMTHEFRYKFIFRKPGPRRMWLFKRNRVYQVHHRRVKMTKRYRLSCTECSFVPFQLTATESETFYFTRIYAYSSWLVAIIVFFIPILLGSAAEAMLGGWLFNR